MCLVVGWKHQRRKDGRAGFLILGFGWDGRVGIVLAVGEVVVGVVFMRQYELKRHTQRQRERESYTQAFPLPPFFHHSSLVMLYVIREELTMPLMSFFGLRFWGLFLFVGDW